MVYVISFLGQCTPPLVGKHPLFADFGMRYQEIRFRIKIEVQSWQAEKQKPLEEIGRASFFPSCSS
jgi:hypothetical protein